MAKLGTLKQKSYPVTLDYGDGEIIHLRVKPHLHGMREAEVVQAEIERLETEDAPDREKIKQLSALVYQSWVDFCTDWDLQGEDDQNIPLTVEALQAADVPLSLLADLRQRANNEVETKKKNGRRG